MVAKVSRPFDFQHEVRLVIPDFRVTRLPDEGPTDDASFGFDQYMAEMATESFFHNPECLGDVGSGGPVGPLN